MTNKIAGWSLGLASLAMMLILLGADVKDLHTFSEVWTPWFLSKAMVHLGNVIMAFIGGKLIPTEPQDQRKGDA